MKKFIVSFLLFPVHLFANTAIFAGGCFWCLEADFDKLPGVQQTISGYDGGSVKDPSYELVSSGTTQYVESVKVIYDEKKVSYTTLINYFFHHIDPLTADGQFCDHGKQYRSVIFYTDDKQKQAALSTLNNVKAHFKDSTVYTDVEPSTTFYPAETYHQGYYKKNPLRYRYYRYRCGRDARVKAVWDISS